MDTKFLSTSKLLNYLRTSPCFLQSDFLQKYNRFLRKNFSKKTNVKKNDNQLLQAVLLAAKGGMGLSLSRLITLPAY